MLHISGHARRLTQQRGTYTTWASRRADQQKTWEHRAKLRATERAKLAEFAGHGFKVIATGWGLLAQGCWRKDPSRALDLHSIDARD